MKLPKIAIILLLGFLIRIIVIFWSFYYPQNPDLLRHRDWGRISYLYGMENTYKKDNLMYGRIPNNLPPGSTYIISGAYALQIQVSKVFLKLLNVKEGSLVWMNLYLPDFFLKLPFILSDLAMGFLIYKIVKKEKGEKIGRNVSMLFLFNPVILYNSAVWGQMDSLNNLMFMAALFFIYEKKYFWFVFFLLSSLFFKFSLLPLVLFLLVAVFISKNIRKKDIVIFLIISLFILSVLTIPVSNNLLNWPKYFLLNNFATELQDITVNAFNFWFFILKPFVGNNKFPQINIIFLGLSLGIWGSIIFTAFILPLIKKVISFKDKILDQKNTLLLLAVISFLVFLFLPRMHERYLYPIFPLLTAYIGFNSKAIKYLVSISILHFLNLFYVWHPMASPFLAEAISNGVLHWVISGLILFVGLSFYYKAIRSYSNNTS